MTMQAANQALICLNTTIGAGSALDATVSVLPVARSQATRLASDHSRQSLLREASEGFCYFCDDVFCERSATADLGITHRPPYLQTLRIRKCTSIPQSTARLQQPRRGAIPDLALILPLYEVPMSA